MSSFFDALGWTLLHSSWQGASIALLVFTVAYRLPTAQQRYWVAYSGLLALLFAAIGTLIYHWPAFAVSEITIQNPAGVAWSTAPGFNGVEAGTFRETIFNWLEIQKPWIVALWLLGFVVALLRLLYSWFLLRLLRNRYCKGAPEFWQSRCSALSQSLGISRPVLFLESGLAKSPMAMGWLKPIILFPVGLINQLSPAETEAILAHELAHLLRRDWLFNLIQTCIETLFYYHPAVWWMSAMVRRERENACDDCAVRLIGNRMIYAKTLLRLQEMAKTAASTPALALGFAGNQSLTRLLRPRLHLLERIRRVLQQPQPSFNAMEKLTASAVLLLLLLAIGWRANADNSISNAFAQMADFPTYLWDSTETDSLPKPKRYQKISTETDKQKIEAEYQRNALTRLNIDGREIPASEFGQYQSLLDDLTQDMPAPPAPPAFPAPPAPAAFPGMPASPGFPDAFAPPARISVDPSEDGATIMRLNRDGKPTEIRIENGSVWIDGKKVEKGQSIDLPGYTVISPSDKAYFYAYGEDLAKLEKLKGQLFEAPGGFDAFPGGDFAQFGMDSAFENLREDLNRLRSEGKISEKELEKREKDLEKLEKDFEKMREKTAEQYAEKWEKEAEKWAEKQELLAKRHAEMAERHANLARRNGAWAAEYENAYVTSSNLGNSAEFWAKQLYEDGVISSDKKMKMTLTPDKMSVNGKKLSAEQHRKYFELFTARGGKLVGKHASMSLNYEAD